MYVFTVVFLAATSVSAQKKEKERWITGTATWYSNSFNGRKTASGEIFSQNKMTCASNKFKIGTWVRVENLHNHKIVVVRVNDRMAPHPHRIIDLTKAAAIELGIIGRGVARVKIESLGTTKPAETE